MPRITEGEIADIVAAILRESPNREASFAELIDEIPNRVVLSADDLADSPTRPNEPMWHQQVRNITSHTPKNANYKERLVPIPSGLRLVD